MAVIDLNNLVKPKKTNNVTSELSNTVNQTTPTYVDLHLDIEQTQTVNLGIVPKLLGDILVDTDIQAIRNSLRNIFTTKKGQKILNPNFGSSLDQHLFSAITETNAKTIGNEILNMVTLYEPRIKITRVNVVPVYDRNAYYISIYYVLLELNKETTLNMIAQQGGQVLI
jgi:phage baseplate assembly protein W